MVNEHTVDYLPSPFGLTSKILPLIFLQIGQGCISPQHFIQFSLKFIKLAMVMEISQIYVVQITQKVHLQIKKSNLGIFTHANPRKSLSQALIITPPGRGKLLTQFLKKVPNLLFYEDPTIFLTPPPPPFLKFCPTPPTLPCSFFVLFLWLNVSSCHMY